MKLQFVEITKRKGKETKKVIFTWSDVTESRVPCVCENFMAGFLYASAINKRELRHPACMSVDGWEAQTWRYHDSDSGVRWQFENGRGQFIHSWNRRGQKK